MRFNCSGSQGPMVLSSQFFKESFLFVYLKKIRNNLLIDFKKMEINSRRILRFNQIILVLGRPKTHLFSPSDEVDHKGSVTVV